MDLLRADVGQCKARVQKLKRELGKSISYSGAHLRIKMTRFMKYMTYFWPGVLQYKKVIMLFSSWLKFTIDWSFKMKYSTNFLPQLIQELWKVKLKSLKFT